MSIVDCSRAEAIDYLKTLHIDRGLREMQATVSFRVQKVMIGSEAYVRFSIVNRSPHSISNLEGS